LLYVKSGFYFYFIIAVDVQLDNAVHPPSN
jgi:hypothetical protein